LVGLLERSASRHSCNSDKMHILIIHQVFTTLNGAGGTRHFELAKLLARNGHEITVITGDTDYLSGGKRIIAGVSGNPRLNIRTVNTYAPIHAGFIPRLLNFLSFMFNSFLATLSMEKLDVVYGTSPPIFQGVTAYLASLLKRAPFVFEVRDLWPDFMVQIGAVRNPVVILLSRWLEKLLYNRAALIIVNSPGFIPHIVAKGIREEKIRIVPNGVDTSLFKPEDNGLNLKKRLGLEGKFIILYAGSLGKSNDIGTVLDAAHLIRDKKDIVILLLGGGNEKEHLEKRVAKENLKNVIFLPPVAKSQMPEYIAASDVGLAILKDIPLFNTTYPNKVFDYMAAGRPVLLAIDGVIRKVVEDAGAGIFISPGSPRMLADGMQVLYENREAGRKMGMRGRKYVELYFERKEQSRLLEEILLELLKINRK